MSALDLDLIRHALATARAQGFAEVELETEEGRFSARLAPRPPGEATTDSAEPDTVALVEIAAPLVGYYREASEPLRPGRIVAKGEVVATLVALGITNDVESKVAGEVTEILVEPGAPVQFGQALARVRPR